MTFCDRNNNIIVDAKKEVKIVSPKLGRPFSNNPKSESIHIRVTPEEKEEITNFAKRKGYKILDLIRIGMKTAEKE